MDSIRIRAVRSSNSSINVIEFDLQRQLTPPIGHKPDQKLSCHRARAMPLNISLSHSSHSGSGLENIIFSKISNCRKYQKYHDIFYIFDIFQKMKISNKLYYNGCNTLMQYLMTISYQSFVPYAIT